MSQLPWYDLNWFDYTMIALVALSIIVSFLRGFVREAISLSIWAIGLVLAFKFAPPLEQHIHQVTQWNAASYWVAFGVIFLSVWIVGLLISLVIRSIASRVDLGFADRMISVCFGVLRGLLVVSVGLMFISMSPYKNSEAVLTSKLTPHFHRVVATLDHYVPQNMQHLTHWAVGGYS
jgi:membrane protein required for colicin V production